MNSGTWSENFRRIILTVTKLKRIVDSFVYTITIIKRSTSNIAYSCPIYTAHFK